ncbi:MAG: oxidoreductase, partial [Alphaproteobacteria bacterium]
MFPHLFSPIQLGRHRIRNRMFITGHMTMMVTGGVPNEQQAAYYEARAKGGVGMIVMEAAAVHSTGMRGGNVIDATRDDCVPGYARIAESCGAHGVPVIGQLFHAGREMTFRGDGSRVVSYAPSVVPSERHKVMPREMPASLILEIVKGHGDAAKRFGEAGLAGSEIVANMGYLHASFLNPKTNRRTDAYGGSFENRLRFIREIIGDVRAQCGDDHILGLRISMDEMSHDGLTAEPVVDICRALDEDNGISYFNIIGGSSTDAAGSIHIVPPMSVDPGYLGPVAGRLKALVKAPVFVAGRINQPHEAEKILHHGWADMCGMTRANICDPEIAAKARDGRADDIRACIGCNQACIGHEQAGYPISCIQHPETGRETVYGTLKPAPSRKRIFVAGGGPAGMKAAAVAAERGHDVTLYEASQQLGGQALLAQLLPGRAEFGGIVTNLAREVERAGVDVKKRVRLDRATVERERPDAVIVTTGATSYRPVLELDGEPCVVDAWDVLTGKANIGAKVLIADWRSDWIGLGLAEKLARDGCRVTLAITGTVPGETIQQYVRDQWNATLHGLGVTIRNYARLYGVDTAT